MMSLDINRRTTMGTEGSESCVTETVISSVYLSGKTSPGNLSRVEFRPLRRKCMKGRVSPLSEKMSPERRIKRSVFNSRRLHSR